MGSSGLEVGIHRKGESDRDRYKRVWWSNESNLIYLYINVGTITKRISLLMIIIILHRQWFKVYNFD